MMGKQEQREKMEQDLRERLGYRPMTPEQFASVVESYIGQRLREAESCEPGTQATEREFMATKSALLDILTDQQNTPSQRLRAVEYLAALPEIFEQLQWALVF